MDIHYSQKTLVILTVIFFFLFLGVSGYHMWYKDYTDQKIYELEYLLATQNGYVSELEEKIKE